MRRPMRLAAVGLAILLAVMPAAQAHASYQSSVPARGAQLFDAPEEVVVRLTEEIDPAGSGLEIHDIQGARIDTEPTRFELGSHPVLRVTLPELAPGAYTVTWKALSTVDGHITGGAFGFAVGGFEAPMIDEPAESLEPLSAAARGITYAGYALALGALASLYLVALDRTDVMRRSHAAAATLYGSIAVTFGTLVLFVYTRQQSGLAWAAFAATSVGMPLLVRAGLASLAVAAAIRVRRNLRDAWFAGAASMLLAAGWLNASFAHSANQGILAVAVDFLHLVSISVWLGGLAFYLTYLRRAGRGDDHLGIHDTGLRFSRLAIVSVGVIAATGVISSLLILGPGILTNPATLVTSNYGRFLLAKISLAAAMVALAAVNRYLFLGTRPGKDNLPVDRGPQALTPAAGIEDKTEAGRRRTRRFQRSVAAEAGLGALVLLLAGFLTAISPPVATEAAAPDAALRALGQSRELAVRLTIDPRPTAGELSNVTFELFSLADGQPITQAQRVRLFLVPEVDPEFGVQALGANATEDGRWTVGEVFFTRAGNHTARIVVSTDTIYEDATRIAFAVLPPRDARPA